MTIETIIPTAVFERTNAVICIDREDLSTEEPLYLNCLSGNPGKDFHVSIGDGWEINGLNRRIKLPDVKRLYVDIIPVLQSGMTFCQFAFNVSSESLGTVTHNVVIQSITDYGDLTCGFPDGIKDMRVGEVRKANITITNTGTTDILLERVFSKTAPIIVELLENRTIVPALATNVSVPVTITALAPSPEQGTKPSYFGLVYSFIDGFQTYTANVLCPVNVLKKPIGMKNVSVSVLPFSVNGNDIITSPAEITGEGLQLYIPDAGQVSIPVRFSNNSSDSPVEIKGIKLKPNSTATQYTEDLPVLEGLYPYESKTIKLPLVLRNSGNGMGVCEVVFTIGNRTAAPDIELDLIISFGKKEL